MLKDIESITKHISPTSLAIFLDIITLKHLQS